MTQPGTTPEPVLGTPELPKSKPSTNHGHTVASWVTMILIMAGALVSLFGVIGATPALAWAGLAIALGGLLVGGVLRAMGLGQPRVPTEESASH